MEIERKVRLTNPLGLHVRVGVKLVEEARKFAADVFISNDEETVDGKDILAILTLGAEAGSVLTLRTVGEDAEAALDHLELLFVNEFKD
tara:strand:- start:117 stop:383 length:267 start_codon:yes stop_codon:yes gene_type:complete